MSSSTRKQPPDEDWDWSHDSDSTPLDDTSIDGIGVLAVHLHQLTVNEPFYCGGQEVSIDTFRICISAYALTRYSKTVRVYLTEKHENVARFDQTMQMITRVYDKRRDRRHLVHVVLYGYSAREKRYVRIAAQVIDSIELVSARHVSEAVVFESSTDACGKATLLIELIFVYGRHGYNYSPQLIFQNDIHPPDAVKRMTLLERILPTDTHTNNPPNIALPTLLKLSSDELSQYVIDHIRPASHRNRTHNSEVIKALSSSPRYSSMTAIVDLHSSRKQRLETLFGFLTDGPHLPEQNILEPSASRLIPWSIAYCKRGLAGLPLHAGALDVMESQNIQSDIAHLQSTSPALRQIIQREEHHASLARNTTKLELVKDITHRVMSHATSSAYQE